MAIALGAIGLYAHGQEESHRLKLADRCRPTVEEMEAKTLAAREEGLDGRADHLWLEREVYIAENDCLNRVTVNGAPFGDQSAQWWWYGAGAVLVFTLLIPFAIRQGRAPPA